MTIPTATRNAQKVATLTLAAALLWALLLAGCGGTLVGTKTAERYNQNPLTVTIPPNLSPEEVERIMVLTLKGRQWQVTEQSPQQVVGTLNHRSFQAKTTLQVNGNLIKILSDSYYKAEGSGELEPGVPKGWLRNLQKDLETRLASKSGQK